MSPHERVLTVGVDVGGTSVRAGLVDGGGTVLSTRRAPTPAGDEALEAAIATVVGELVAAPGVVRSGGVGAVGLAVAGFVAVDRRCVHFAPHLSWRGAPVVDRMARRLGLPVLLEHDANAAAAAEYRIGAARDSAMTVLVALGTGIGGALLIGGEPFRGAYGVAPELGHLPLVPDGRACACGKRGCWERYCSGTALAATAADLGAGRLTSGEAVAAAARAGDPMALAAFEDLAHWLGVGLALVADVYDPDLIVLGGGLAGSAELFLDAARVHGAAALTGSGYRPVAGVVPARLGADAGIVGAALLARDLLTG